MTLDEFVDGEKLIEKYEFRADRGRYIFTDIDGDHVSIREENATVSYDPISGLRVRGLSKNEFWVVNERNPGARNN